MREVAGYDESAWPLGEARREASIFSWMNATPPPRAEYLLCAQTIVRRAVKPEKSLVVTAIQSKGPFVLNFESRSRATTSPIPTSVFALVACPLVDALANLVRDVARPGFLLARANLVRARFVPGSVASSFGVPLQSSCPLSLQVLLVERDVQGLLHDLGHVLERVLHTEDFRQALELLLEFSVGGEAEIEELRPCWLEDAPRHAWSRARLLGRRSLVRWRCLLPRW